MQRCCIPQQVHEKTHLSIWEPEHQVPWMGETLAGVICQVSVMCGALTGREGKSLNLVLAQAMSCRGMEV